MTRSSRSPGHRSRRHHSRRRSPARAPISSYVIRAVHVSVLYRLSHWPVSITQQTAHHMAPYAPSAASIPAALQSQQQTPPPSFSTFPSMQEVMWRESMQWEGGHARRPLASSTAGRRAAPGSEGEKGARPSTSFHPSNSLYTQTVIPSVNVDADTSNSNFIRAYMGGAQHRQSDASLPRYSSNGSGSHGVAFSHRRHDGYSDTGVEMDGSEINPMLPFSTMDLRELSKIIVRDAVFAELLDLVPSRACVQCAVWQLGPQLVQVDAAITVQQVRGESNLVRLRAAVVDRLAAATSDPNFFAGMFRAYLGDMGCRGGLESVLLDGLEMVQA